jgi:hypothetical protein
VNQDHEKQHHVAGSRYSGPSLRELFSRGPTASTVIRSGSVGPGVIFPQPIILGVSRQWRQEDIERIAREGLPPPLAKGKERPQTGTD